MARRYYVNEIVATEDPEVQAELRRSRPEHAAVEELTKRTQVRASAEIRDPGAFWIALRVF